MKPLLPVTTTTSRSRLRAVRCGAARVLIGLFSFVAAPLTLAARRVPGSLSHCVVASMPRFRALHGRVHGSRLHRVEGFVMVACAGAACNFARDYEIAQEPLMREIERRVRGSDYGATSWTTREQAERASARLELGRGLLLLELGAGSGWPALFLATLSGCDVVLTDLPLSGLRIARERAEKDRLDRQCSVLAADGAALPFADHCFDRIHHADVLCCMER